MSPDEELKNEQELKRQRWQAKLAERPGHEPIQQQKFGARPVGPRLEEVVKEGADEGVGVQVEKTETREVLSPRAFLKAERAKALSGMGKEEVTDGSNVNQSAKQRVKMVTAEILLWGWKSAIGSFGLSLIALSIYGAFAYIGQLIHKGFCRFGEEWFVRAGGRAGGVGGAITGGATGEATQAAKSSDGANFQAMDLAKNFVEYIEIIVVGFFTFYFIFNILVIGAMFYFFMHPCVLVKEGLSGWGVIAFLGNVLCGLIEGILRIFFQFIT